MKMRRIAAALVAVLVVGVGTSAAVAGGGPVVTDPAEDAFGLEGGTLAASGAFLGLSLTITADNTEGTFTDNGDGTWSWSYATNNDVAQATITVTATQADLAFATDAFDYRADNVLADGDFGAPPDSVNEGATFQLTFSNVSDPSSVDTANLEYRYDCGTGTFSTRTTATAFDCVIDEGDASSGTPYTVRGRIVDQPGSFSQFTDVVMVVNVDPSATFNAPASVAENASFQLSLTGSSDPSSVDAAGLQFRFDCGDGTLSPASSSNAITCAAGNALATLDVRGVVIDPDGGSTQYTDSVDVLEAALRPDGMIRRSTVVSFVGNDIYNSTGVGQTRMITLVPGGAAVTYVLRVQNDATVSDRFRASGPGSGGGFKVKYLAGLTGTTDVTAQVRAGTYLTNPTASGNSRFLRMIVRAGPLAPSGAIRNLLPTFRSNSDPTKLDTVRVIAKTP